MNSRKSLITFVSQLLVLGVNVVALKATLASLSPEDYGLYGYALSLTGLFMVFSELNLSSVFFKRIAEGHSIQQHYSTYVAIRLLLVAAAVAAFLVYGLATGAPFLAALTRQTGVFATLLVYYFLDAVLLAVMGAYQARREVRRTQVTTALMSLANLAFIIAFVTTTGNVWLFAVSLVVKPLIGILCFGSLMKSELKIFRLSLERSIVSDYLRFALPLLPMSILAVVYDKLDGTLVTRFLSFRDNGFLTAATMFNALLLIPSTALMTLLYSSFSEEMGKGNLQRVQEISHKATKYLSLLVSAVAMFFFFYADAIVPIAMSRDYLPAVPIMRVFMFQIVLMSISRTFGSIMMASEKLRVVNALGVTLSLLGIVLDFVFIPERLAGFRMLNLGAAGPAYKALVVYIVSTVLSAAVLKRCLNITIYWRFLYHVLAGYLAGRLTVLLPAPGSGILALAASFALFISIYLLLLFLVREIRKSDTEYLYRAVAVWRVPMKG